jgi:dephospho-CoA kinase
MILGVTGCPGSGKSLLAAALAEKGWTLVDVDALGREVVEGDGAMLGELARLFGEDIIGQDGKLNRRLLARRAFSTSENTGMLNRVVHPTLIAKVSGVIRRLRDAGKRTVVDCALIYEWGIEALFHVVVCVRADADIRRNRLMERDLRSAEEVERIFAIQLPECDKAIRADIVLANNGPRERLIAYGFMLSDLPVYIEEGWKWVK